MDEKIYNKWTTQLRKGMLELAILRAVSTQRLYGYEITKLLSSAASLVITEGTVYPILNRLKREGFLDTSLEESQEGPVRKYFKLTPLGKAQLHRMNEYWNRTRDGLDSIGGK